jgi:ureidoacrylate peracid hydrolase
MEEYMDIRASTAPKRPALLQAKPEPIEIDLHSLAVVVIDMQNAFLSKGGFFDLMGVDTAQGQQAIGPVRDICKTAIAKQIKLIYVVQCYSTDLREAGNPSLPNWYKGDLVRIYNEHPEWRDKLLIRGSWGADLIKELELKEGSILVEKPWYSAFIGTTMDMTLKTLDIKYLAFVGVTTNICVEASIRDAFYHGYFPILVSDATEPLGPPYMKDATIFNVSQCYGWVTTKDDLLNAVQQA